MRIKGCKGNRLGEFATLALLVVAGIVCFISAAHADRRVLVVIEDVDRGLGPGLNGQLACADLIGAGIPFDVLPYTKLVTRSLDPYDVIILNGQTGPTPVTAVRDKIVAAVAAGKKVFVNGRYPSRRYDDSGAIAESINYPPALFGVTSSDAQIPASTIPQVPSDVEKDPDITAMGAPSRWVMCFSSSKPLLRAISAAGKTFGFLCDKGGIIDSDFYSGTLLDFGKVVNCLRYGNGRIMGFANDRAGGRILASFMVDCDNTHDLVAIDNLVNLHRRYGVILDNMIVYGRLDSASMARWNQVAATETGMFIGCHTWTHPNFWAEVTDPAHETIDAIAALRQVIPSARSFMNLSGNMEATPSMLDLIYGAGIVFQNGYFDYRLLKKADGSMVRLQVIPYTLSRLQATAQSTLESPVVGLTLPSDYRALTENEDYSVRVQEHFAQNRKYGMPNYGYIHDVLQNPSTNDYFQGTHMSVIVERAMQYLAAQNVRFYPAHDLVRRMQDSRRGNIEYEAITNGIRITARRPEGSPLNEIKVQLLPGELPWVEGSSVEGAVIDNGFLYISLHQESESHITIRWTMPTPSVSVDGELDRQTMTSNLHAHWTLDGAEAVQRYEYAIGTTPGGTDVMGWTDAGLNTEITKTIDVEPGAKYYLAVKALCAGGAWSQTGISEGLTPLARFISPSGLLTTGWSLISLPAMPNDLDPQSVLAGVDLSQGTLLFWDNQTLGGYRSYGQDWVGPMRLGDAYWVLNVGSPAGVSYLGTPHVGAYSQTLPAGAAPRWVTFGFPFETAISADAVRFSSQSHPESLSWKDACQAGIADGYALGFANQRYYSVGPTGFLNDSQSLEPWQGYWIMLLTNEPVAITYSAPAEQP